MDIEGFHDSLLNFARHLRPPTRSPFIPLVRLARSHGVEVELRFYSADKRREAQTELSSLRPRILLYRRSDADGVMTLAPDKEHLLTHRERFSVAHELGHFFAFRMHGALPVTKKESPQEYRKQEECMDHFAQTLLVPDWLAQLWLMSVPGKEPVSLNDLTTWAVAQCAISGEVVARALTRLESTIGFLKTAEALRANGKRLFVVFYSAYGTELRLPNLHSFIEDEVFVEKLKGSFGADMVDAPGFGHCEKNEISMTWQQAKVSINRKRKEFKTSIRLSGRAYWISFRSQKRASDGFENKEQQLSLFA